MRCFPLSHVLAVMAAALLGACDRANNALEQAVGTDSRDESSLFSYNREYVFVAPSSDGPLVVPFNFSASERGDEIERGVRGWLARGSNWDRFVDETENTSAAGGVWRI